MHIQLITQPAPTIDAHIQEQLDEMWPRVFMRWNPRYSKPSRDPKEVWDARWEIWVELADTSHPGFRANLTDKDIWNTDAQCWMRRLQAYETAEGKFAPADERLIIGLHMADTWSNRRFYEDRIEQPADMDELRRDLQTRAIYAGAANYYSDLDRTLVGRHSRSADWRWRNR